MDLRTNPVGKAIPPNFGETINGKPYHIVLFNDHAVFDGRAYVCSLGWHDGAARHAAMMKQYLEGTPEERAHLLGH